MQTAESTLTPSLSAPHIGRIVLRFTGCDVADEVLLVPAGPGAFQWRFAGSPDIPASDPFPSVEEAWSFAWKSWPHQIQFAENWPLSAR